MEVRFKTAECAITVVSIYIDHNQLFKDYLVLKEKTLHLFAFSFLKWVNYSLQVGRILNTCNYCEQLGKKREKTKKTQTKTINRCTYSVHVSVQTEVILSSLMKLLLSESTWYYRAFILAEIISLHLNMMNAIYCVLWLKFTYRPSPSGCRGGLLKSSWNKRSTGQYCQTELPWSTGSA